MKAKIRVKLYSSYFSGGSKTYIKTPYIA